MPRYIDAEILESKIDEMQDKLFTNDDGLWDINKPYYAGLAIARGFLNDTPTVDVQEVKHGKWIERVKVQKDGIPRLVHWQCSLCEVFIGKLTNFCPNCGAKMDGE